MAHLHWSLQADAGRRAWLQALTVDLGMEAGYDPTAASNGNGGLAAAATGAVHQQGTRRCGAVNSRAELPATMTAAAALSAQATADAAMQALLDEVRAVYGCHNLFYLLVLRARCLLRRELVLPYRSVLLLPSLMTTLSVAVASAGTAAAAGLSAETRFLQ